jgi:adenylate cyclase
VVGLLNMIFSRCDELAERFRLEKIKTVGDAYMVVGGIDHDEHDHEQDGREAGGRELGGHPADVADMGLAILDELARFEGAGAAGLQMRIGMHVGPAIAGVIGLKKFIYDVWGDTVNTGTSSSSAGASSRSRARAPSRRGSCWAVAPPKILIDLARAAT